MLQNAFDELSVNTFSSNKYRRIVDISRESGRINMHTDDISNKGERFIGELSGNCEKLKGRKFQLGWI